MSYSYAAERETLFTEDGSQRFVEFRDKAFHLIDKAGAVRMDKLIGVGDAWFYLACADRMIETGELRELTGKVAGQFRVFVRNTQ